MPKIALLQHSYKNTKENTISFCEKQIQIAAESGAKIVCFQELFCYPYFCQTVNESNFELAETIPGEISKKFSTIAAKFNLVLIIPYFEKRLNGLYNNTALVIDADGAMLGVYRKHHIPEDPGFHEKYYFSQGDGGYKVFNTKYGKISVLICWDQWYPEASRIVSLMGAEIIFYPTAIGILAGEESLQNQYIDAWETIQRASAIANGVFVASVNRVGVESKMKFWGNSFISDPFGKVISKSDNKSDEIIYADIDFNLITKTRIAWPFLRDRRIETYQLINQRALS